MIPARKHFRFGIPTLLLLTALIAVVIRLTYITDVAKLTFDDLKFDSALPNGELALPASIVRLDEKRVRIRG